MADNGSQHPRGQACRDGGVEGVQLPLGGVKEDDPHHGGVPAHGVARIDLDGAAVSDHHDPAELRDHGQILGEVDVRQHLQDHIRALAVRHVRETFEVIGGGVVEDEVGSLLLDELSSPLRSRGPDDPHPVRPGKLDGGQTHAAAGAVNQDGLSRQGARLLVQRPSRCRIHGSHTGALGEREGGRKRPHQVRVAGQELGIAAAEGARPLSAKIDAVPNMDAAHAGTDGLDHPAGVASGDEGHRRHLGVLAGPDIGVHGVDAGGLDPHQHLSRSCRRIGGIFILEDVWLAGLMHSDGFHDPSCAARAEPLWTCPFPEENVSSCRRLPSTSPKS